MDKNSQVQFIDSVTKELDSMASSGIERSGNLNTVLSQYVSALKDYVQAKRQYIDYLDKYQTKAPEHAVTASMPGIQAALPSFSQDEMVGDTSEMQELGELVKELREQLDMLEHQITAEMGLLFQTIQQMGGLKDQAISYLDQYIEAISGVYDAGFMVADL